jgi:hypothetical protein
MLNDKELISPEKFWEWYQDTLARMHEKVSVEKQMPSRNDLIRYWAATNDLQLFISRALGPEFVNHPTIPKESK